MQNNIEKIKNERRYYFPVRWIFPNPELHTVSAFCKKNFETGFHIQSFYEIIFITRGSGYHFIGNETLRAEVGDVFVVPPGLRHAFSGGEGFDVHHFHFSPHFFDKFMSLFKELPCFLSLFEAHRSRLDGSVTSSEHTYRYMKFEGDKYKELYEAFDELVNYIEHHIPYYGFIAECKASVIICLLCQQYAKQSQSGSKAKKEDKLLTNSILLLREEYDKTHTLEELADIAKMSKTTYVKRFKEQTGMTPRAYALNERIKRAKHLLRNTDMTVAQIAESVGFYDTSHFIKCFSGKVGISPSAFRSGDEGK